MAPYTILPATATWPGTMSEFRVWYASRDAYHCIFRMVRLLSAKGAPLPVEQLRILDMLLMFPALLYRMKLTTELRHRLKSLEVQPEAKSFVRLPGTASVWQDLQIYQLTALKRLAGLGLLAREELMERVAHLDAAQMPANLAAHANALNADSAPLMNFLVDDLGSLPMGGAEGLVRRAGLPARGLFS